MNGLPPPGRWALGADAHALAEELLLLAQRQGLRTGWLAPEAGFLSNLSLLENLHLLHEWHGDGAAAFDSDLQVALALLHLHKPEWLHHRPAQLRESQRQKAALLRVCLLKPEALVLHPVILQQGGVNQLIAAFADACLLLLADPAPDWPAWLQPVALATKEDPA